MRAEHVGKHEGRRGGRIRRGVHDPLKRGLDRKPVLLCQPLPASSPPSEPMSVCSMSVDSNLVGPTLSYARSAFLSETSEYSDGLLTIL